MTGYDSKRAAARDKLDDNDALTIAYQSGFYDGKKAAAQEPTKYSFKAHWEEDGCIGVVAAIERLDGGVHLLKDTIDAPQPAQEPVAHLCGPDKNGLFGLPTEDKACKDCFPVYRQSPQPAQEPWRESASDYERGVIDGRQMQAQSSVDKAVNAMTQRTWVDLTDEEVKDIVWNLPYEPSQEDIRAIEAKLKEKNT